MRMRTRLSCLSSFSSLAALLVAVAPSAASAYKLQGPSWDIERGPIPYHLHPSGSDDVEGDGDLEEVRAAFRLWSCVEGSGLRFLEADEPGEKVESLTDGKNNVFWDEDGTFALGPGTYSVTRTTAYVPEQPAVRDAGDIILNGFDHSWTTGAPRAAGELPIFNVMVREIGVLIGLGVDCEPGEEGGCPGPDETVMAPFIPGPPRERLLDDDIAAVLALYATDDGSSCEGPFRQGEACSCNEDCVGDMICAPDTDGKDVCSPTCSSEDASCPTGFSCVLSARGDDGSAAGRCVRIGSSGSAPVAGSCQNDRDCGEGLCASVTAIGRTACRVSCDEASDCPAQYECNEGHCTWAGDLEGIVCGDGGPCACQGTSARAAPWWLAALGLVSVLARRRRRPGPRQG